MSAGKAAQIGPFRTEQEAREAPAVQAVYRAFDADPGPGKMHPHNLRILTDACSAAEVTLGEYDRRIVSWLAGWEPATAVVIAGIIRRAADGPDVPCEDDESAEFVAAVTAADLATVLSALDEAADELRDRAANCPDCDRDPADLCTTCESRLARADGYDRLAARLGGAS